MRPDWVEARACPLALLWAIMRLLQAAVCAALVATLGGCFLLPTADEQPKPTATPDAAPQVGDCWEGEYTSYQTWTYWHGDEPIDCEERHQSYTFAISDAFEDGYDAYPFGGFQLDETGLIAYDACRALLTDFLGAEISGWARLETSFFAPSAAEWREGARWLRCDLMLLKIGSSIFEGELQRLPDDASELVDDLDENDDAFDFCVETPDGWYELGPYYSADAYYADCTVDPMWRLLDFAYMPGDYQTPYPGDAAVQQFVADTCFSGGPTVAPFAADYPDEQLWKDGWSNVSCWKYEWEVPETTLPPV